MDQFSSTIIKQTHQDSCWSMVILLSVHNCSKTNIVFSATALQSLEIASDTILSGKAKVMIAGSFDNISEEDSYKFANMKATSNAEIHSQWINIQINSVLLYSIHSKYYTYQKASETKYTCSKPRVLLVSG